MTLLHVPQVDDAGHWVDREGVYTDATWLAEERRALWRRSWVVVAPLDDLVEHGDLHPSRIADLPVVAVRDNEDFRIIGNVCRHRVMVLCRSAGRATTLNCAYHGWRYGLDGRLLFVPKRSRELAELDENACQLPVVPSRSFAGLLLGRLEEPRDDEPDPFARLEPALVAYDPARLPVVLRQDILVACNWKLLVENHLDGYHLWFLHERTLAAYNHRQFTTANWPEGTWTSFEPLRPDSRAPTGLVAIPKAPLGMGAFLLFPGLLIVTTPWWLVTAWLEPLGTASTAVHLLARAPAETDPDALSGDVLGFVEEDLTACEAVQSAVCSRMDEGPLADTLERDLVAFRRRVSEVCHAKA